jgi:hypothetical protein
MAEVSKILLIGDDPHDPELTPSELTENHLVSCPAAIIYERSACRPWVLSFTNPAPCYMLL